MMQFYLFFSRCLVQPPTHVLFVSNHFHLWGVSSSWTGPYPVNFGEYVSPTKGWSRPLCETICGYVSKTRCLATLLMYTYIYIYHLVCILINIWTADWAKQLSEAIVPSLALRSHPESNMNFTSESYKRKFPFFQRVPCLSGVFVISAYGYQEFMFPTSWTSFVSGSDSRRPEGMMWTCHSLTRLDTRENCPDMIFRWGRSLIEDPFPATC